MSAEMPMSSHDTNGTTRNTDAAFAVGGLQTSVPYATSDANATIRAKP